MQLIKPISTFLIHSAYINSRQYAHNRNRYPTSNFKLFETNDNTNFDTYVVESDLPSILSTKIEVPLMSREEKLRRMLMAQSQNKSDELLHSRPGKDNLDKFESKKKYEATSKLTSEPSRYGGERYGSRTGMEFGRTSEFDLDVINRQEMNNKEMFKPKNYRYENSRAYGEDSSGSSDPKYSTDLYTHSKSFNKDEYRKKNARVYEPIEVRLSLRIQEADLLNKCKFFKKKAVKGYPLKFVIRIDGNPDDFVLAAEGILNKARMFLSDSCKAPNSLSKSNTAISLLFTPLEKYVPAQTSARPVRMRRDTGKYSPSDSKDSFDQPATVRDSVDSSVATPVANISSTVSVDSTYLNRPLVPDNYIGAPSQTYGVVQRDKVEEPKESPNLSIGAIQEPISSGVEKTSRFMTLNKKRESRWIVKHSKDEAQTGRLSNGISTNINSTNGFGYTNANTLPPTMGSADTHSKSLKPSSSSGAHSSSKWKVLNKK